MKEQKIEKVTVDLWRGIGTGKMLIIKEIKMNQTVYSVTLSKMTDRLSRPLMRQGEPLLVYTVRELRRRCRNTRMKPARI